VELIGFWDIDQVQQVPCDAVASVSETLCLFHVKVGKCFTWFGVFLRGDLGTDVLHQVFIELA